MFCTKGDSFATSVCFDLLCVFAYTMTNNVLQCNTKADKMKTEMLSTRIDHDTKFAFTHICDEVGLSPSQAIKLFAKAVINHGGIPFELRAKQPNTQTLIAIKELEQGEGHKAENISQIIEELGGH